MTIEVIPYILAVMIFWDLSLHIIELSGQDRKFIHSKSIFSYYYPHFRWRKTNKGTVEKDNWKLTYQKFWVSYWGVAFVLTITYLIIN